MFVSVITVTYQAEKVLEATMRSVLEQTFTEFEYIIQDGGSTDGTMAVAESFGPDPRIKIVSEKDKGIYDAMNRATERSEGTWLIYLNAGDKFYDADVLKKIFSFDAGDASLIYGNHITDFGYQQVLSKPLPLKMIFRKKPFNHQASFVKGEVAKKFPFDLTYRICADYDFTYR
ncbi:MAG: glycosyltransferase family 2 protein, partial [Saprospiraceae bacterium]